MKKMHAISGNKQFMTKRAIPLLKKYGIQKSRANLIGGKTLELRFLIDDDKLERINKELKKMNRTAYDGIMEQLRKVIREEIQKLNEVRTPRKALDANKVKNPDDFWKVSINKINKASGTSFGRQREVGDVILWLNFAIDAWNKGRVRESVNEGGMGILGKDQADILQAIVMRNKNKNSKAIFNLVMKTGHFKGVDKKEMLGYIEGAKMFAKYMRT
jgi:hypothetical protein